MLQNQWLRVRHTGLLGLRASDERRVVQVAVVVRSVRAPEYFWH